MYIIVGLGNPTAQYDHTRHNIGFDTITYLADRYHIIVSLVMAILVYCYSRMFSRDYNRRYAENQKFLTWQNKIKYKVNNWKRNLTDRKTHHIYKCPSCGQKIRVPRGKGKIIVTCPKCRTEFQKKS